MDTILLLADPSTSCRWMAGALNQTFAELSFRTIHRLIHSEESVEMISDPDVKNHLSPR